jgi:hypothetical protein
MPPAYVKPYVKRFGAPPPHQRLLVPDGIPVASQAGRFLPRNKRR